MKLGCNYNSPMVLWPTVAAMIIITLLIHSGSSEKQSDRPIVVRDMAAICEDSEGCNLNGVCIKGICHCTRGFGGERCNRCAAAYHGFPRCQLDETCYAVSWLNCANNEVMVWKNEGLLPGRPKRAVALVPSDHAAQNTLGVQIVQGLWGGDTISLKLCWLLTCGPRQQTGGRSCRWENGTSMQVYIKNTGCGVDIGRKPSRTTRPGAGFKGECDHPSARTQQICSLPSKRYSVFVRDASWYMDIDEAGNRYLEAANWRGHYARGEGLRPVMGGGKPKPASDGFIRFTPLNGDLPKCENMAGGAAKLDESLAKVEK